MKTFKVGQKVRANGSGARGTKCTGQVGIYVASDSSMMPHFVAFGDAIDRRDWFCDDAVEALPDEPVGDDDRTAAIRYLASLVRDNPGDAELLRSAGLILARIAR